MRAFKGDVEIRLTREDVAQAIEEFMNKRQYPVNFEKLEVQGITLHPSAKYVVRATIDGNIH